MLKQLTAASASAARGAATARLEEAVAAAQKLRAEVQRAGPRSAWDDRAAEDEEKEEEEEEEEVVDENLMPMSNVKALATNTPRLSRGLTED